MRVAAELDDIAIDVDELQDTSKGKETKIEKVKQAIEKARMPSTKLQRASDRVSTRESLVQQPSGSSLVMAIESSAWRWRQWKTQLHAVSLPRVICVPSLADSRPSTFSIEIGSERIRVPVA